MTKLTNAFGIRMPHKVETVSSCVSCRSGYTFTYQEREGAMYCDNCGAIGIDNWGEGLRKWNGFYWEAVSPSIKYDGPDAVEPGE